MDCPADFVVADTDDLPRRVGGFDLAVSGLVLNFLAQPANAVRSMRDRTRTGGDLAAYVWDYSEGMEFLRVFWEEAVGLDPSASHLAERHRFPLCRPSPLTELFAQAGLADVEVRPFDIAFVFPDFDAYWSPFLGGTGPAPSYVGTLDTKGRTALMNRLKNRLVPAADGSIRLTARAFGIRGLVSNLTGLGVPPNNSLKLTRRAGPSGRLSCPPAWRTIEGGLPASAGQLSSRPLGGSTEPTD